MTLRNFFLTRRRVVQSFVMAKIKWPKAEPNQVWLLDNGWKRRRKRSGQDKQIFVSPCGQFVCKRGYFSCRKPDSRHIIPCKFISMSATKSGEWHYRWVIQPFADISERIRDKAEYFLNDVMSCRVDDIHENNVAMYLGRPVLIDW